MFFTFRQNNTGGFFTGPAVTVIVEAMSRESAASRAKDLGLYFNGVHEGRDCPCCGDRWYEPWAADATNDPEVYDRPVLDEDYEPRFKMDQYYAERDDVPEILVYFADGQKKIAGYNPEGV